MPDSIENLLEELENERRIKAEALDTLKEVFEWISNWNVPFADDDEWRDTASRIETLIHNGKAKDGAPG